MKWITRANAMPNVELGHVDGRCSFESIRARRRRGNRRQDHPRVGRADAIAHGFALVHGEADLEKLRLESPMYDALYTWCQSRVSVPN